MARTQDLVRRSELLAGVVEYIADRGLAGLSLRPVADYLDTSSRMLIHYFGTKEAMLVAALETQRPVVSAMFADIDDVELLRERLWEAWESNSEGASSRSTRVVLQVLAEAGIQGGPFLEYAQSATADIVRELAGSLRTIDPSHTDPEAVATILVSGVRGLLVDRLVTGDHDRVDRSARMLIEQTLPSGSGDAARETG
ncbi:TetR family transcriptional regulator [Rhodococcus sp. 06-235-1A]|uniref:TetR/AcrR family transcriptional regulator n=1 Tax=Rhodococcus sp. 06-235-1A TaxID=2022508 RepID=UPI000B9C4617|nr:TetR/AcrR family transcriptional regulator [Rhodococcus sp. 06-235-1A]OZD06968.1 TetR family transcriptional regulator [Rhodococcus sp. 06-235-1A]